MDRRQKVLSLFQQIPGVGIRTAEDLWSLGFRQTSDLKGADPEEMYARLCKLQGVKIDRCMLYVFRCSVYYASDRSPKPELLKWWRWSDSNLAKEKKVSDEGHR